MAAFGMKMSGRQCGGLPDRGRGGQTQVAGLGGERGLNAAGGGLCGGCGSFNTECFHQLGHPAAPCTGRSAL